MALNIIIRDKRTEQRRVIQERAVAVLKHYYGREGKGKEEFLKVSKAEVKRAWEHDAVGDIDPAIL
jgi:hypothetical protein